MPFIVQDIRRAEPNRWAFDVLGLHGWPCFAVLETDDSGHGLRAINRHEVENLVLWEVHRPIPQQVLSPAHFEVPEDAFLLDALRILTVALTVLGWGKGSPDPKLLKRIAAGE